ncbi:glycosyltransferase involved in cell wall biosynthesis [Lutibacter sp. Hel_I_33_5]|uniref:glycosyltransferase family 4 protein n=1 Tax=Lutibacter sp. Hel_I_33_5 TaxID=1566289 RepID=UPI0011A5AB48|nr:glycosyltransferase family 4 protein [Lutibacter sp. Hel_I_33_5]TVZ55375.1 glycosyltransferase involved in cell wall biosynthesis [Lutibacter sp. Hel_I_33_5]
MFKEKIIFILFYKWKYLLAILKSKSLKNRSKKVDSITYVAREADKDWIFGAKVNKLSRSSNLNADVYFHDRLRDLPVTDGYFFVFHQYFYRAIRHNPQILNKRNIIMFTHPNWTNSFSKTHVSWCLNLAYKIICLNSTVKKELIEIGVKEEKLELIHIASNPEFFYHHERKSGAVGFCSAYGPRKNAQLIFDIINNMPEKHFYILGKGWENFERFEELSKLKNFTYYNNEDYHKFPDLYTKIDTFISASFLEGGPVPILEAMLSNCFPIATKTGFCPDIIEHGKNGFLIDLDITYKEVIPLIKEADNIKFNVRETVLEYSWEKCAKKIDTLFLS